MKQAELDAAIRQANSIFSRKYRPNAEPPTKPKSLAPQVAPEPQASAERSYEAAGPKQSLDAERRFGQSHARLFPFIDKRVWTPRGTGVLLQVFAERCEILPDGQSRTVRVRTEDVSPIQ
jgi:hypothetical protein